MCKKSGIFVLFVWFCLPDSTVLAHVMKLLAAKYSYGIDLFLLSVDEGITGYRDDSLETVKRNESQYEIPLKIVSYKVSAGSGLKKTPKPWFCFGLLFLFSFAFSTL